MTVDSTPSPAPDLVVVTAPEADPTVVARTISARRVAVGTLYNLIGLGAPLIIALLVTPYLIRTLGLERYAVLSMMWVLIGYASLFDLGLGRSLTKVVAEKLGAGLDAEVPGWTATGLVLLTTMSIIGALLIALLAGPLFGRFVNVPVELQAEVILAVRIMAIAIPFVVLSAGLRGVVEAHQDFRSTNTIRAAMGIYLILCPLFTAPWNPSLVYVAITLVLGRAVFTWFYFRATARHVPALRSHFQPDWRASKPLLRFGGWLTVTSIVSPLLVSFDRILIGGILTVTAVAYYATAVDLVARLLVVVSAMSIVLFPMFSSTLAGAPEKARVLYKRSIVTIKALMFPITFMAVLFGETFLRIWLGEDFAVNASLPLQILVMGVFFTSQANSPLNVVQGAGRPDITAKYSILELFIFLPLLWLLTSRYGIVGAALVWSGRLFFGMLVLAFIAQRFMLHLPLTVRTDWIMNSVITLLFASAFLPLTLVERIGLAAGGLLLFGVCAWLLMLSRGDRERLLLWVTRRLRRLPATA